jgi:hypothetical protein
MRVVHQTEQGLLLGRRSQQRERSGTDEKAPVERRTEPEGTAQGSCLSLRDFAEQAEQRPKELVQTGKCKLRLGLDPAGEQHPHPVCASLGVAQKGGLANPRLSAKHKRAPGACTREGEQRVDALPLGSAPH